MRARDLASAISEAVGVRRSDVESVLKGLAFVAKNELANGDRVAMTGIGSFYVKLRAPRVARHPVTHQPIKIKARRVVAFKASNQLFEG